MPSSCHTTSPPHLYARCCLVLLLLNAGFHFKWKLVMDLCWHFHRRSAVLCTALNGLWVNVLPKPALDCGSSCMLNKSGSALLNSEGCRAGQLVCHSCRRTDAGLIVCGAFCNIAVFTAVIATYVAVRRTIYLLHILLHKALQTRLLCVAIYCLTTAKT